MKIVSIILAAVLSFSVLSVMKADAKESAKDIQEERPVIEKVVKTDQEWKDTLTEEEFYVLRQKGTERAFTGDLLDNHEKGTFLCAGCGLPVFSSETKFESGSGWPSFWDVIEKENVIIKSDRSFGMVRNEVTCARCDGHLGHVFDDGPEPTGQRYCINSVALDFEKSE